MSLKQQEEVQQDYIEIGRAEQEPLKVLLPEDVAASIRKISRRRTSAKSFGLLIGNKYEDENHVIVYVDHIIPIASRFNEGKLNKTIERLSKKKNGQEIVGWYGAYAGSGAMLKEEYERIHRRFFGKPWQFIYLADDKSNSTNIYYWHIGRLRRSKGYYQLINDLNSNEYHMQQDSIELKEQAGSRNLSDFAKGHSSTEKFSELIKKYENDRKLDNAKRIKRLYQSCALAAAAAIIIIIYLQFIEPNIRHNNMLNAQMDGYTELGKSEPDQLAGQDNQELENLESAISDLKGRLVSEEPKIEKLADDEEESENPEPAVVPYDDEVIDVAVIYIIQKGDTLSSISEKYYGDPSYGIILGKLNRVENYSLIKAGDYLIIPSKEQIDKLKNK